MTTPSVLQLQTQRAIHTASPWSMQNLRLSKNHIYNTLTEVRKKKERDEYSSMFDMVGRADQPYVRDVRIVKGGVVFLLATEGMLLQGTKSLVFAGDATFKTETNPHYERPDWYLYNIVTPFDLTTPKHKAVVVSRALMTSLTVEAYAAVWVMFLKGLKEEKAKNFGLKDGEISVDVPYMTMEPERKANSVPIRAVTTDFEVAEVEGIAAAFAEQRGGSAETHLSHLLVGCRVHFERAMLKRAAAMPETHRDKFKDACRRLQCSDSIKEADEYYSIIDSVDNAWGAWLSRAHVRPLVSPAYSDMRDIDRMMALDNTNIVESQNRRGNLICGTRLDPVLCTHRLSELDTVSTALVGTIEPNSGQKIPMQRSRKGHTLSPSGSAKTRERGGQNTRAKKRKCEGVTAVKPKTKRVALSADTVKREMDEAPKLAPDHGEEQVIPDKLSDSMKWLHEEQGSRCKKAGNEGNTKLLVALSDLYSTVLKCNDLSKIKYNILCTMRKESTHKRLVDDFTDLLLLTTKKEGTTSKKGDDSAVVKEQASVVDLDESNKEVEKDSNDTVDVMYID